MLSTIEKNRNRAKTWYWGNRDAVLSRLAITQQTPQYKAKKAEYDKRRRGKKGEKIKAKFDEWYKLNRGHVIETSKRWKRGNPEKTQYNRYKERALKKNLRPR